MSGSALPVVTFGLSTFTLVQQTAMCVRCPGFMLCGELQSVSSLLLQRPVQYGRVSSVIAFDGLLSFWLFALCTQILIMHRAAVNVTRGNEAQP